MKKFTKVTLIIAAVCMVLGVMIITVGSLMGGAAQLQKGWRGCWEPVPEIFVPGEETKTEADETFAVAEELSLSIRYGELTITMDPEADEIVIRNRTNLTLESQVHDDKLELEFLTTKENRRKPDWGDYDWSDYGSVEVVIPENSKLENLELEVFAGVVVFGNAFTVKELELEVSAGAVDLPEVETDRIKVDSSAGSVLIAGNVKKEIEADCSASDIELTLDGKPEDFDYEINVSAGSVCIDGSEYSGMNDKKHLTHKGSTKKADLECGAGSVTMNFRE